MGANVTAISHSENKKDDAEQSCTARFIAALGRDNNFAPYKQSFNFILCTPQNTMMSLVSCLSLLRPGGALISALFFCYRLQMLLTLLALSCHSQWSVSPMASSIYPFSLSSWEMFM